MSKSRLFQRLYAKDFWSLLLKSIKLSDEKAKRPNLSRRPKRTFPGNLKGHIGKFGLKKPIWQPFAFEKSMLPSLPLEPGANSKTQSWKTRTVSSEKPVFSSLVWSRLKYTSTDAKKFKVGEGGLELIALLD